MFGNSELNFGENSNENCGLAVLAVRGARSVQGTGRLPDTLQRSTGSFPSQFLESADQHLELRMPGLPSASSLRRSGSRSRSRSRNRNRNRSRSRSPGAGNLRCCLVTIARHYELICYGCRCRDQMNRCHTCLRMLSQSIHQ